MARNVWRRNLTRNLVWLRKAHGLSQRDMAKRLGIGVSSLRKLERGTVPPRLNVGFLLSIAQQFGISPGEMLEQELK